jgi:hypothetical protein
LQQQPGRFDSAQRPGWKRNAKQKPVVERSRDDRCEGNIVMTEKQIEKIKVMIIKHRATLVAEKRKFGGFGDGAGRRYF